MQMNCQYVFSYANKKRPGLVDHSNALVKYGHVYDTSRVYKSFSDVIPLIFQYFKLRSSANSVMFIVWDNSPSALFAMIFSRVLRAHTVYYYHEPGGFYSKLSKGSKFIYTCVITVVENCMKSFASNVVVSTQKNTMYGGCYLPLLFDDEIVQYNNRKIFGFVGAKRSSRFPDFYIRLAEVFNAKRGYDIGFFPSAQFGSTLVDKKIFLSKCVVVWNYYGAPYNLSGVTGDCIVNNVPLIVSSFEPQLPTIKKFNIVKVLDIDCGFDEIVADIELFIDGLENENQENFNFLRSKFGGGIAFRDFWLPYINKILSG